MELKVISVIYESAAEQKLILYFENGTLLIKNARKTSYNLV